MLINSSLALKFLQDGKTILQQKGWNGREYPIISEDRLRWLDAELLSYDTENSYECKVTGGEAIQYAMTRYEAAENENFRKGGDKRRSYPILWTIRPNTISAHNMAKTFYGAALMELFRQYQGLELDISALGADSGSENQGLLTKDLVLKAFDFAIASLKVQIRTFAQTMTVVPNAIAKYRNDLQEAGVNSDKVLKEDLKDWERHLFKPSTKTRKITIKNENTHQETDKTYQNSEKHEKSSTN